MHSCRSRACQAFRAGDEGTSLVGVGALTGLVSGASVELSELQWWDSVLVVSRGVIGRVGLLRVMGWCRLAEFGAVHSFAPHPEGGGME